MSDNSVRQVIVNESYSSGSPSEVYHNNVDLVVVKADHLYVWFKGTHYISQGTASEVNEGDLFFQSAHETQITRVINVDESIPSSEPGVEIESLFGPTLNSNETITDQTTVDQLTGQIEDIPMGYAGPPTLIVPFEEQ